MTMLYPNLCYNEVSYKGTEMYMSFFSRIMVKIQLLFLPLGCHSQNKAGVQQGV